MLSLPTVVGVPITRTIAGTDYSFPRLNQIEYGQLFKNWLDEDMKSIKDEAEKRKLSLFVRGEEDSYIFSKLTRVPTAMMVIDASLAKGKSSISAEKLEMEPEDLCGLACEIWSRMMLRACVKLFTPKEDVQEAPQTPKDVKPDQNAATG